MAILDAIPNGEMNTALRICNELRDIADYYVRGFSVRYYRLESIEDLRNAITSITSEVQSSGLLPWLHLEGHGHTSEPGFITADNTFCTWSHLKDLLIPLNIATQLNLILVLATCFGGSFAQAITTVDRAPVLGLIGPIQKIQAGDIEIHFSKFYKTFLTSHSLRLALQAMTQQSKPNFYYITNATDFFVEVWNSYKDYRCSEPELRSRERGIYRQLKRMKLSRTPSVGAIKRWFSSEEERQFSQFRDTYFMYDLFPECRNRFPVVYKDGRAKLAR